MRTKKPIGPPLLEHYARPSRPTRGPVQMQNISHVQAVEADMQRLMEDLAEEESK
jgi:hypothetical protein